MSDTNSEPTTDPKANTDQTQGDPADLGDGGKKALDVERAARKVAEKSATDLKAKLDQIEAASLSDLEKAQRAATDAASELAETKSANLRMRVALEAGLPLEDVDRIKAGTEEDMLADAKSLAGRLGKVAATPKPDPSQGARGGDAGATTADQFAGAIEGMFTT